ncbi:MAG: hypothetical protein KBC62_02640 [Candidatus Pacebacteria bacterium]|nr:hypothetical protein [Candidatus Paceibacterota bacterium]
MKNIWITGSINSGKSTVAKILGVKLKMAAVELDAFSEFVEAWMPFEDYIKLNYDLVSDIVSAYNRRSVGVIVVYPLSEKVFADKKEILSDFDIFIIDPGFENALNQRGSRVLNEWEIERIKHQYETGLHQLSAGVKIDTSNLTPEETSETIIKNIVGIEQLT